jgi:hypothetical protein
MLRAHRFLSAGLFVAVIGISASACAAQASVYGRPNPRTARAVDRLAYDRGYTEGRRQGENDARRRRSFDYARHDAYRNAEGGYSGYGNRGSYRATFREGFTAGYTEGYRRYAGAARGPYRYPNGGPVVGGGPVYRAPARFPSRAAEIGFRDGSEQGRRDARDRKPYDPVRADRYRSVRGDDDDDDDDDRRGSRDQYVREYRAAFLQGYEAGYRY